MTDSKKPRPISFGDKKTPKEEIQPKTVSFPSRPAPPRQTEVKTPTPLAFPNNPPAKKAAPYTTTPKTVTFGPAGSSRSEEHLERATGKNIITPEEARFNTMVAKAVAIDAVVGSRPGFAKQLQALVAAGPRGIINWGAQSLEVNRAVTDRLATITRDLSFQDVSRWVDEAQTESTRPPSRNLLDRFKQKPQTPEFYEHKLGQIRSTLEQTIMPKIDQARREINDIPDVFAMEVLALKVWAEGLADASAMQIADNRHRILLQAQQGILMTEQALANVQVSVAQSIQQIDELLLTVLPKWKIAFAHQAKP